MLVGSVCTATEDQPGSREPVDGDPSYIWLTPIIGPPSVVLPPTRPEREAEQGEGTPPIVVTNPTDRLFATFNIDKVITGATEGIVNPQGPYRMEYTCQPGSGPPITGTLDVTLGVRSRVGPEELIPADSVCVLTEPLDSMPPLIDPAWSWGDPTFTVDGLPAVSDGRGLLFVIPRPQEDTPEPIVGIVVTNNVTRTFGSFTVAKSSNPPGGSIVEPGGVVTYSVAVTSTGAVPVHDIVVRDDMSGVLGNATIVDGSIVAPGGTTASVDLDAQQLVWTVGTLAPETSLTLTYQVRVNAAAKGVTIANLVSVTADVPPTTCPPDAPTTPPCSTNHQTVPAPNIAKEVSSPPTRNADGTYTLAYDITVTNAGAGPVDYDLTDSFAFAEAVVVTSVSATNVEPGDIPTNAAFNGTSVTSLASSTLPAGATHRFRVTVTADVAGVATANAFDCALDPGEEGTGFLNRATVNPTAEACAPIPPPADLAVVKTVDRAAIQVDRASTAPTRLNYTITVTNIGIGSAEGATISDTLPAGVVPVSATPTQGACQIQVLTVQCSLGTIAPGASAQVAVAVNVPPTQPTGTLVNVVIVDAVTRDSNTSNNSASASTNVTSIDSGSGGIGPVPPRPLPPTGSGDNGMRFALIILAAGAILRTIAIRRRIADLH